MTFVDLVRVNRKILVTQKKRENHDKNNHYF